jgi:hypothetical protein
MVTTVLALRAGFTMMLTALLLPGAYPRSAHMPTRAVTHLSGYLSPLADQHIVGLNSQALRLGVADPVSC